MLIRSKEEFKNKVRLIYEYDRKSPLFARIANWELDNNNTSSAIEILEQGLREYPDYPTPYFILGKAYILTGEYVKALKCYKKGSELIHSNETYEYYAKVVENMKRQGTPFELRGIGFPDELHESLNREGESKNFLIEENLGELAERISQAKIPVTGEENKPAEYEMKDFSDNSLIVSETLAKIYITQGEVGEAVSVYEKLKIKNPEKADYYSQKISELKEKPDKTS
jgi:tetratricopeptide (TPR) repeat protein